MLSSTTNPDFATGGMMESLCHWQCRDSGGRIKLACGDGSQNAINALCERILTAGADTPGSWLLRALAVRERLNRQPQG